MHRNLPCFFSVIWLYISLFTHTLFLVIFSVFLQIVWAGPCRFSSQRQVIFGSWSWEAWSSQILQRNRTVRESEGERILLGLAWASRHHGGLSGRGLVSRWLPSLRSEGRQVFSLRPGKSLMFLCCLAGHPVAHCEVWTRPSLQGT